MYWVLKILFFTNILLPKEPAADIYTFHQQICHFVWAEDFSFQLEIKPNQTFYFSRSLSDTRTGHPKTYNDFVSGNYQKSNDTLFLNVSATTHQFVKVNTTIIYLMRDNELVFANDVNLTILPDRFNKTDKPIIFNKE